MSDQNATFVRYVGAAETIPELAHDAKALTWDQWCEHAVLELDDGRRVIVMGGRYGIDLDCVVLADDPFGRPRGSVWVTVEGHALRVVRLVLHTHPEPTGPSDDDLRVLELLGQDESLLFEIFGPHEGTVIRPKRRRLP